MKKIDWTRWSAIAEILSAIAIFATLLYLAVQTRYVAVQTEQNNRLLSAQAAYLTLQNRSDMDMVNDPELAAFWLKVNNGEPLNAVEQFRVEVWASQAIRNWEWEYGQYRDGNLPEAPVASWRAAYHGQGLRRRVGFSEMWERMMPSLDEEFVAYIQEWVIQPGPP